jgi:hypothetical protein
MTDDFHLADLANEEQPKNDQSENNQPGGYDNGDLELSRFGANNRTLVPRRLRDCASMPYESELRHLHRIVNISPIDQYLFHPRCNAPCQAA